MIRYAVIVAIFSACVVGPSLRIVSQRLLKTERAQELVLALGCAVGGVLGLQSAHRLLDSHAVSAYLYVVGLPGGIFVLVFIGSRLSSWTLTPSSPASRRLAPPKSRVR